VRAALIFVALVACGNDHAVTSTVDGGTDDDPLASITDTPAPGSLDDLHARIIVKRCSGQPGLCHNGQFEPNLSTPAMTYAYLVNRPGIENQTELRANPGHPESSLLIDKLRNRNGVSTQMPLGAEPLAEEDIAAIEAWIAGGALRAPGDAPAPVLNNPPKRPEIAVFDTSGTRLDGAGPVHVSVGQTVVLRHTVQDFETPDASIPFAGVALFGAGNNQVILGTGQNKGIGQTVFDVNGPMGIKDKLDFKFSFTIPATLPITNNGVDSTMPASGAILTVLAFYIDGQMPPSAAFDTGPQMEIQ
jgi:hypothetical protein